MAAGRAWTENELRALPRDGFVRELVDGEIRVGPAGAPHGRVVVRLLARVAIHVEGHGLGEVFDATTGCWMPSGNVRVADLAFVGRDRLAGRPSEGFLRAVPDLVAEVLAPGDSHRRVLDEVGEGLAAGVRMAWVIDPRARRAAVHRSLTTVRDLGEDDDLDGEDVLPGFRCRLGEVLG